MLGLILTWLITAISFIIISKLPIGVEIDSFGKALMTAAVFGILNALLLPLLTFFTLPFIILTLGLFFFVLNSIIFGISAAIVPGFRLRYGFWSSTIGSIALAIVNSILSFLIPPLV
ncbi:MAG: phage holin family protein [Rivularia sp. T60_A2020_040]|nr:phage holin family protein [Rivularia sp. T60_A2020_040]